MLLDKIKKHSAVVGVVGMGYVGLPLAVLQAKNGFRVIGVDEVQGKIKKINAGENYIGDVDDKELKQVVKSGKLTATTDFSALRECDIVLIAVPTPLTKQREPDLTAVLKVTRELAKYIHPDMLVVLESTTYPGTTEEVMMPILTEGGLKVGQNLYMAFSPERVDPGNHNFKTQNTFKLVGGVTKTCLLHAQTFYEQTIVKIFPVSSPRVAELTKVYENVFRSVNIALANELAMLCDRMGLNVYEVIDAASTKNFGFMPFYPGPGVGGHCIPLDPYYLAWKSKEFDMHTRFIELAGEINENMPYFVVQKLQRLLNKRAKCLNGAKILVLGVTYKADVADPRETPAEKVMSLLRHEGADLSYSDPHAPTFEVDGQAYKSVGLTAEQLKKCDAALILTAHSDFDMDMVVKNAPFVFDTRNGTKRAKGAKPNVVVL